MQGGGGAAMAAAFKTVEPLEYYKRFLKENCRPDGRELGEFQATTVNIGSITTAGGSALVKLGSTTVICGVKAELAAPAADSANKGYIAECSSVDLAQLPAFLIPSTKCRAAIPLFREVSLRTTCPKLNILLEIKSTINIAKTLIDFWWQCLILDHCNFFISSVQLPSVIINEETGLSEVNLKQKTPLIIRKHPVATSFAVFDDTVLIVDPTAEEEDLATGTVTIVTDEESRLCSVHKPGGSLLTRTKLQDCITRAITRHKEVKKLIDKVIKSIMPK
ncbi:PREDICTED: exosome complex component RRP43-like [Lepidothrix coronata]|uniref:Ribosomal RNA-processing protein 43 n=1 Tax=Lepidothrix coronata TaxID=321398 RepID=A0A6J0IDD8_9PASS|nr:PREDICTED: exosome complex component RRP43-like [Lepidothrix coronata]